MGLERSITAGNKGPSHGGDDLSAARDFVGISAAPMAVLLRGELASEADITPALETIITGAQNVKARAVARAAQNALTLCGHKLAYQKSMQWQGQILVLNKLLSQYSAGVSELWAETQSEPEAVAQSSMVDAALMNDAITGEMAEGDLVMDEGDLTIADDASVDLADDVSPQSDAFAFAKARETLAPLIQYADSEKSRSALSRLARIDRRAPDDFQPVTAPITTGAVTPPPSVGAAAEAVAVPKKAPTTPLSFESMMPAFTTTALRAARQSDKTLSVSYGVDGVSVPRHAAIDLDGVLCAAANWMVDTAVERSTTRMARGESGAAHIALSAHQKGSDITLIIHAPQKMQDANQDTPRLRELPPSLQTPMAGRGTLSFDNGPKLTLQLPLARAAKPSTAPDTKARA